MQPSYTPPTSSRYRPRILVVEDDDEVLKLVSFMLSKLGDVTLARSGEAALDELGKDPLPRVIVTDIMMPGLDGYQLVQRLKADTRTQRIPVLMLTAKSGTRDIIAGINAGARHYLTKPFKSEDLVDKVRKLLASAQ